MKKTLLRTILDEDLVAFLESTSQLDLIEKGAVLCTVCNRPITLSNLQLFIPLSKDSFDYICNDPTCIKQAHEKNIGGML